MPEWQRLRLQHSNQDVSVPNLVIRRYKLIAIPKCKFSAMTVFIHIRPSVVQGIPADFLAGHHSHHSSRKNSGASVVSSGSGGSSPENTNYLRVSAAFGQRRLSDNVLTASGGRRLSGKKEKKVL